MTRIVWRVFGVGIASVLALGCGGDAEQDERGGAESGGAIGDLNGGEGGTSATSSLGVPGTGAASGRSAADGADGTGGVTDGIETGGVNGVGSAEGGSGSIAAGGVNGIGGGGDVGVGGAGGIATGGASGSRATAGGAGSASGSGGGLGGAWGTSGSSAGQGGEAGAVGGGGGSAGHAGLVSSGAGGIGGAAEETGTGGTGLAVTACSEPPPAVELLEQGWWLCGWSGGLDHYSWLYFGTNDQQMLTLAILDATCTHCASYFGCAGTDGEYSTAGSMHGVGLAMPSGCAETNWTIWEMTELCPPDGYPPGSSAYVTLTDRITSLRCDRYPLDQCDATLPSCPMPLESPADSAPSGSGH